MASRIRCSTLIRRLLPRLITRSAPVGCRYAGLKTPASGIMSARSFEGALMRRRLPWIVLTALALLLPSASAPASAERGSKLFLWKATSPTTEVYLFGSIHLGKQEFYPLAKEIEA